MNLTLDKYTELMEKAVEENFNTITRDLNYAIKMYEDGELEMVDELLQRVITGSSVTMALVAPLTMVKDDDLMRMLTEGGADR